MVLILCCKMNCGCSEGCNNMTEWNTDAVCTTKLSMLDLQNNSCSGALRGHFV